MKKQILNLGKGLSKAKQRNVFGGFMPPDVVACDGKSMCDPEQETACGDCSCTGDTEMGYYCH